ncbi:MAG TPA: metallophosphoesterase [Anaeromyxobacteraceae bacterium]|nr:metallophosphoesterase [Anaeromyxobacteraceae bacterium]
MARRAKPRAPAGALCAALIAGCAASHPIYREPAPLPPATAAGEPALRVLVLGDFGDRTHRQRHVAEALRRWSETSPFDLVLQPGDNLYDCGPDPGLAGADRCRFAEDGVTIAPGVAVSDDPLFRLNEAPLTGLRGRRGGQVPVYLALGNHDIGEVWFCFVPGMARDASEERRACLEVAHRSPTWRIPGRHYVLDEGSVRFIVVDSNVAATDYGGFTFAAEEAFVREASAPCDARPCFLVTHYPPALASEHPLPGPLGPWGPRMRQLVAAAGGRLAAVLAGHQHALEHLTLDGVDVFIAGAGARGARKTFRAAWPAEARLHFASSAGGFGVLEARAGGWSYRAVDERGRTLHCCDADGRGPCRPVACPVAP